MFHRATGIVALMLMSLPARALGDSTPPQYSTAAFQVSDSTGGYRVAGSTTDILSPIVRVQVQDAGSGLRVGPSPLAASSSTVLLLRFDESSGSSAFDASATLATATLTNVSWTSGRFGTAGSFDGSTSQGLVADTPELELSGPLTIEVWAYYNAFTGVYQTAVTNAAGPNNSPTETGYLFPLIDNFNQLGFRLHIGGTWQWLIAGVVVSTQTWTHLAATYDGAQMRVYKNGVLVAQQAASGPVTTNNNPVSIGFQSGRGDHVNGLLDEVRILNRALSPDEVASDYNSGAARVSHSGPNGAWTYVVDPSSAFLSGVSGSTAVETATAAVSVVHGADNRVVFLSQDQAGNLAVSPAFFVGADTAAPAAVVDLAAAPGAAAGGVRLSFSAPSDDPEAFAGSYAVQYSTDPAAVFSTSAVQVAISTTGVAAGAAQSLDLTLDPNTTYYLTLWSRDSGLNWSPASNLASAITAAQAVSGAQIQGVFFSSATAAWQPLPASPSSATATGYVLQVALRPDFQGVVFTSATSQIAVSTLGVQGLQFGTSYYFRIGSLNSAGQPTYVSLGSRTTLSDPNVPQFLAGTFAASDSTGGFVAAGSTTDLLSPQIRVQVQDAGVGLRVGLSPLAASSSTALLLHLDEGVGSSANDASGNNPAAVLTNVGWGAGRFGTGGVFDGSTSQAVIPNGPAFQFSGPLTIEAWAYYNAFNGVYQTGVTNSAGPYSSPTDTGYQFPLIDNFNQLGFRLYVNGAWQWLIGGVVVSSQTWTHLAATYDGAQMRIYKNGILIAQQPATGAVGTNGNPLSIGFHSGLGENVNGLLDEVRLLNRALSADEVASDYNSGAVRVSNSGPNGPWTYVVDPASAHLTGLSGSTSVETDTATVSLVNGADNRVVALVQDLSGNLGASPAFSVHVDTTGPAAVGDLKAVPAQPAGDFLLSFTVPASKIADQIAFAVQYSTDPAAVFSTSSAQVVLSTTGAVPGSPKSVPVTGLFPNTTYYFREFTEDSGLRWSPASNAASAAAFALPLTGAAAVGLTTAAVTVAWPALAPTPASASAAGYALETSTSPDYSTAISSVSAGVALSTLTSSGLLPNSIYYLRAASLNVAGARNEAAALGPVSTLALPPSGASITLIFGSSVTVSWTPFPSSPTTAAAEGFRLEASTASDFSGALFVSTIVGGTASTVTLSGLPGVTTSYLRLGSLNSQGAADYVFVGTVRAAPSSAPTGLAGTALSPTDLSWTWGAVTGDGYHVYSSSTGALLATTAVPAWTQGGLSTNTAYGILVAAEVGGLDGPLTPAVTVYTLADPPLALAVVSAGSSTASLAWSPADDPPGTAFELSLSSDGFSTAFSTPIAFASLYAASSASISGLLGDTPYQFRVRAQNGDGVPTAFALSGTTITVPATVVGIGTTSVQTTQLLWSWSPVPGAQYYKAYRASTGVLIATTAATALTETGLSVNTTYGLSVTAVDGPREGFLSAPVTAYTLAADPAGLQVLAVSSAAASLAWNASGNPGGTRFEITASTDGFVADVSTPIAFAAGQTATAVLVTGLSGATTYQFRVRAENGDQVPTAYAFSGSTTTFPARLAAPSAVALSPASLQWSWSASGGPAVVAYRVYRPSTGLLLASTTVPAFSEAGLSTNSASGLAVSAVDSAGEGPLSSAATYFTLAASPRTLAFVSVGSVTASLAWDPDTDPPTTAFEVSASSDAFQTYFSTPIPFGSAYTAASAALSGLLPGTTYTFRVRAENGDGLATAFTNLISTKTFLAPVSGILGSTVGTSALLWSWTVQNGADFYTVRSASSSDVLAVVAAPPWLETGLSTNTPYGVTVAASDVLGEAPLSAPATNYSGAADPLSLSLTGLVASTETLTWDTDTNPPGTFYEVSLSSDGFSTFFSTPIPLAAGLTLSTASVSGLSGATLYSFRVRAGNGDRVPSGYSNVVATETVVSVVTGVGAPVRAPTRLDWAWSGAGPTATAYHVFSASSGVILATVTTPSFSETGLSTSAAYGVRISAKSGLGEGPLSAASTAFTLAATPGVISVTALSSTSLSMQWDPQGNPGGVAYHVQASTDGFVSSVSDPVDFPSNHVSTTAALTALFSGTTYSLQVQAKNTDVVLTTTPYSPVRVIQTLPGPPGAFAGSGASTDTVNWSWNGAAGPAVFAYRVYDGVSGSLLSQVGSTGFLQTGLSTNTAHVLLVSGVDASGEGQLSVSATAFSLALPPSSLSVASLTASSATLTWPQGGNPPGTRYEISMSSDGILFATPYPLGANLVSTQAVVAGLTPGTTWLFRLRAANGGAQFTTFATASTQTLPGTVAVAGSATGPAAILWSWSGNPGPATLVYRVYRAATGLLITTTTANVFFETGLATNTAYGLAVSAVDLTGEGPLSSPTTTYTLAVTPLGGPTTTVGTHALQFSWGSNGNSAGTVYDVLASTVSNFTGFVIDAGTATGTSRLLADLGQGTTYFGRVKAINGDQLSTGLVALPAGVTLTVTNDAAGPVVSPGSLTMTGPDGVVLPQTSTANASSPLLNVTVQDAGSGLRAGQTELAASSATVMLLHLNEGQGSSAIDFSQNSLDASVGAAAWTAGRFGAGLRFNGSPLGAQVAPSSRFNFSTALTVEAWVNSSSLAGTQSALTNGSAASDSGFDFPYFTGGHLGLRLVLGIPRVLTDPVAFTTGTWTFVAATYDGATMKVYRDGKLAAQLTQAGSMTPNTNPLSLGSRPGASEDYNGLLDEVRILSRALSADEIASDYLSGAVRVSTGGSSSFYLFPASVTISGVDGSTAPQTLSAAGVPLVQGTSNKASFLVQDLAGNETESAGFQLAVDTTAPGAVGDLAASSATASAVTLAWTAPADDPAPLTGRFRIQDATGTAVFDPAQAQILVATSATAGTSQSLTVSGLFPNTTHTFVLWSEDRARNVSGASNASVAATLAPPASVFGPTAVFATSATVSWAPLPLSPSSATCEGYVLDASTASDYSGRIVSAFASSAPVSSLTVTDLRPSSTYFFRVATLNQLGLRNTVAAGSALTSPAILSVSLSTGFIDAGALVAGQTVVLPVAVNVANTGNVRETFQLLASTLTPGSPWTVSAAGGADALGAWAGFSPSTPVLGAFGAPQVLFSSGVFADASRFAFGTSSGARVSSGDSRTLWLKLQTPLPTSTTADQLIQVVLQASDADNLPGVPPSPSTGPETAMLLIHVLPITDFGLVIDTTALAVSLAPGATGFTVLPATVTIIGTVQPVELDLAGGVSASTAPWTLDVDEVTRTDQVKWYALFSATGTAVAPALSSFAGAGNLVTAVPKRAGGLNGTGTGFSNIAMPGGVSMDGLPSGAQRNLWFRIDAPPDSSGTANQTLQLSVTATRSGL